MSRSAGPSSPVSAASRASKASRSSPRPRSSMSPTGLRHDAADCPGLMAGADHKARRGRPREFCTQEALATAMRLFWAKGFEGTSVSDLAGAMGISKPSLYAAFGDKEALFAKARSEEHTSELQSLMRISYAVFCLKKKKKTKITKT